jgi:lipooligosaccharide transport system permease protein
MSAVNAMTRLMPIGTIGGARAGRVIERSLYLYRRNWWMLVSGLFEPLFYLLGIGFGLGGLVGSVGGAARRARPDRGVGATARHPRAPR